MTGIEILLTLLVFFCIRFLFPAGILIGMGRWIRSVHAG